MLIFKSYNLAKNYLFKCWRLEKKSSGVEVMNLLLRDCFVDYVV